MHPYTTQYVAAARARELQQQAAAERRAREARRARRGQEPMTAGLARDHRRHVVTWA